MTNQTILNYSQDDIGDDIGKALSEEILLILLNVHNSIGHNYSFDLNVGQELLAKSRAYEIFDCLFAQARLNKNTRIVVAMSGGVDSTVVASVLHFLGYEIIGLTMKLYEDNSPNLKLGKTKKSGTCCVGTDALDAEIAAKKMGFTHYIIDYQSRFHDGVIMDLVNQYAQGFTPIPCIRCNEEMKFKDLIDQAKALGAKFMATGHYLRREMAEHSFCEQNDLPKDEDKKSRPDSFKIYPAKDREKDQSYFLFSTTTKQLSFLRFPLGALLKSQTRKLGHFFKLSVADKKESQDICFVPGGNYRDFIKKIAPSTIVAGEIRHVDGRVLGRHGGIIHYTIGQRRGLGIGGGEPLYVVKIDPKSHIVFVGEQEYLTVQGVKLIDINWILPLTISKFIEEYCQKNILADENAFFVKIRSTGDYLPATLSKKNDEIEVCFQPMLEGLTKLESLTKNTQINIKDQSQQVSNAKISNAKISKTIINNVKINNAKIGETSVSPGQACVFYWGDKKQCLGGGWISETILSDVMIDKFKSVVNHQ